MKTVINGVTYYAKAKKSLNRHSLFYPVIEFYGREFGRQNYWLNTPQPTRSKALTIAKNHIKNIKN